MHNADHQVQETRSSAGRSPCGGAGNIYHRSLNASLSETVLLRQHPFRRRCPRQPPVLPNGLTGTDWNKFHTCVSHSHITYPVLGDGEPGGSEKEQDSMQGTPRVLCQSITEQFRYTNSLRPHAIGLQKEPRVPLKREENVISTHGIGYIRTPSPGVIMPPTGPLGHFQSHVANT